MTVVGGGAWGTALAVQAVRAGEDVELILRNEELADRINTKGENDLYLPGVELPG
ncbi:MAG TPA: glycerol-3-phosphate acyltransferase, partial [Thalassospira sp.]|nr:glycerol-3-phosphate acyltransferase [Thalassospira sp.]